MFFSYVLLALRTFAKNKTAIVINLLGMSIALGCCIAAYVNYEFNANFDTNQKDVRTIYRISFVNESEGVTRNFGVSPMPMPELIRANDPEVNDVIRYISKDGSFRIGDEMFRTEFVYTDPNFLNYFTLEAVHGHLDLHDKSSVLISDKLALTYFGNTDVVGEPLTQIISGSPREFVIGGVYRSFPSNSSFRFQLITTFENYFTSPDERTIALGDWKRWTTTFLSISDTASVSRVESQLQQYVKAQNEAREDLKVKTYYLEPFKGMAMRAVREKKAGHWFNMAMPPAAVVAPFLMAAFLLLVACFNFTNNAIAVAGKRLKEIGIRKVIGGRRKELVIQFLAESLIFCFIALAIGLILAEYFVAGWDAMWPGIELSVRYGNNLPFLFTIAGLLIVTALLAGGYPAFYISAFKPVQVLKGTTRFGGTNLFTKSLLVFQFSISLAAVIFALAFYFNSKFQKSYDLGYDYRSVIQVPVENGLQFAQLSDQLERNPAIKSIGGSQHHIYTNSYKAPVEVNGVKKEVDMLDIGEGYFETVNVRVIQGRSFIANAANDQRESLIVNEEFVRFFKLGEGVGKRVLIGDSAQYFIVGVVKDVYLKALFQPLAPLAFKCTPEENYRFLVASTDPDQIVDVNKSIRQSWMQLFPTQLYTGRLMEDDMVMAMEHFDNVVILYTFLGIVAIVMSVSGLFSLVSLHLQKRTKELGVRKILGASLLHLALQASKLFLIVMAVSFVLGGVLGSFMVNKLMDSVWEYYVAIDSTVIGLSIVILLFIATATVGIKIMSVTKANPSDSLRYE